jgi:F-type H+-transporting ATPase subunit delta
MVNTKLAGRYAKSLMDIAIEQNAVDAVYTDASGLTKMFAQSTELTALVKSPIIKADKKIAIFKALVGGKISTITEQFVNLIISKNREAALPQMMTAFIEQYKTKNNIVTVELTTAEKLEEAAEAVILKQVNSQFPNATLDVKRTINADIIGGFILEVNNKLFDASVARDLRDIKKQFASNIYLPNIK